MRASFLGVSIYNDPAPFPVEATCSCSRETIELDAQWSRKRGAALTINLKPEQERIIQAEIESGHYRSPDEVLDYALAALQEKERERRATAPRKNLAQFLLESPLAGAELNLERAKDYGRPLEL